MSGQNEPSDQDLIARIRGGENTAFSALMQRHKNWLYRFVRRYVRDSEEAYDVTQEAFVSAWGALNRYDPTRPFDIWLRRIALNKCRDRARKEIIRRRWFRFVGAGQEESEAATDPAPTAEQSLATKNALARLNTAIDALPRALKDPLVLTALEGMSHAEAGEVLGLNAKAVEMRIYRARKQLAEILERSDLADLSDN